MKINQTVVICMLYIQQSSVTELLECKQAIIQYHSLDMFHISYQIKVTVVRRQLKILCNRLQLGNHTILPCVPLVFLLLLLLKGSKGL